MAGDPKFDRSALVRDVKTTYFITLLCIKYERYVSALWNSIICMCTVGLMDIGSQLEKVSSISIVIGLVSIFAYSLNKFGFIINDLQKYDEELK